MSASPASALILIDLQKCMAAADLPLRNNPQAEDNAARLLDAWRLAHAPIVHVRHMSRTPGSPFWPGKPGVEFQARFAPLSTEQVFEKNVPDAFVHSGLERWLRVREIGRLVFMSLANLQGEYATVMFASRLLDACRPVP